MASVSPGMGTRPSPHPAHILVIVLLQALPKPPKLGVSSVSCWTLTDEAFKLGTLVGDSGLLTNEPGPL